MLQNNAQVSLPKLPAIIRNIRKEGKSMFLTMYQQRAQPRRYQMEAACERWAWHQG
jgi:hypothetical protein